MGMINAAPPYKQYVALLTQNGTAAPTASVLVNTLGGTVVLTRTDMGEYALTLAGAFPTAEKVWFSFSANNTVGGAVFNAAERNTADTVIITTRDSGGSQGDALLSATPIEIRVYP